MMLKEICLQTKDDNHLMHILSEYNNADSLIYGIGNIGRQDDGLGWAFIDWLEEHHICPQAETMKHYQLHLEDADMISYKKRILFVDATMKEEISSFHIEKVKSKMDFSFTSHAISVPSILATCQQCFDYLPEVYLLEIRGYEWELQIGLTSKAKENLEEAIAYFGSVAA